MYLDNAASTIMPKEVIVSMVKHMNMGNPSAAYSKAGKVLDEFRRQIAEICGLGSLWHVIICSSASEANCTFIDMVVNSYVCEGIRPHIASTSIEHKSILEKLQNLVSCKVAEVTLTPPNTLGFVNTLECRPNTVLAICMRANNETGATLDVSTVAPQFIDAVQYFPKFGFKPPRSCVGFSLSAHKFGGPAGTAALCIRRDYCSARGLRAIVAGSQNGGLRGGTESTHNIAGASTALTINFANRDEKNKHLLSLKRFTMAELGKCMPVSTLAEYYAARAKGARPVAISLVFISGADDKYLPHILMLSVVKITDAPFCNVKLKKFLSDHNVIVSIGSACNTASTRASHVIEHLDPAIKRGILRVSFGDTNTREDAKKFIAALIAGVKAQT